MIYYLHCYIVVLPVVLPVKYMPTEEAAAVPLPTYDQSEKYEVYSKLFGCGFCKVVVVISLSLFLSQKEGVLELGDGTNITHSPGNRLDGAIRIFTRQVDQPAGSWGEFIMFFVGKSIS